MATKKQELGKQGEELISKICTCPKCKKGKTLRILPVNFKCADLVCDFCGYMAQVKSMHVQDINTLSQKVLGGAWSVQKERMNAGIYFPLFLVLVGKENDKNKSIFYLSAVLQNEDMFVQREPLSQNAKRAGWQGFYYDLTKVIKGGFVRLI